MKKMNKYLLSIVLSLLINGCGKKTSNYYNNTVVNNTSDIEVTCMEEYSRSDDIETCIKIGIMDEQSRQD